MLGLIFSSLASDLYNLAAAVPDLISIPMNMITTPRPPTHCSRLLRNSIEYGRTSTFTKNVIPLPVHADMFSKRASTKCMCRQAIIITAPIRVAHSHAKDDMNIPCFSLRFAYFLKILCNATPNAMEHNAGAIRGNMYSNSP